MIYKPNNIIRCMSNQSSYIGADPNNMFYFTDKNQLWYDTSDGHRVQAIDIIIIYHEYERNNFIPNNKQVFVSSKYDMEYFVDTTGYCYVYVVESNSLYKYQSGTWFSIYGRYGNRTTVAQTYYPDGNVTTVYDDDVSNNGILNDGSVVVRDSNRMICALLKSNGYVFDINSLIGGQINLNPSGETMGNGTLSLNSNAMNKGNIAFLNGDLVIFGNIYQAAPEDWAKQYRLITEDVSVVSKTIIKAGSTIKKSSILGDYTYTTDTILSLDVEVTTGRIMTGSKIYKDSVINDVKIRPPFIFDVDKAQMKKLAVSFDPISDESKYENSNNKGED